MKNVSYKSYKMRKDMLFYVNTTYINQKWQQSVLAKAHSTVKGADVEKMFWIQAETLINKHSQIQTQFTWSVRQ